jgi:hypothetical protein
MEVDHESTCHEADRDHRAQRHGHRKEMAQGCADQSPHAVEFYSHFRALFCTERPFQEARKFFSKYADERFMEGIPLHEALYALVLMRRHIWLYAEFQAIFITAVEQHQAVESLTRTILMFDYATYVLAERYEELMKREMNERLKAKKKGEEWSFYETLSR